MIQRQNDGVRWELQPDFAPFLDELLRTPGQTIKESPVKQVTRHLVADKIFYVKRYLHHAVPLRSLKFFLKPTQARVEWRLAQQLEARRIPIVRHVALGERHTWSGIQESILITEGFDAAQLDETEGVDPSRVKAFVDRMHAAGVLQVDLHPANLLIGRETGEIRLVDLHGTVVRESLSQAEREENLAVLRGYIPFATTDSIRRASERLRRERIRDRARRCLRRNRDFDSARLGTLAWQHRREWLDADARAILQVPDEFLARRAKPLKQGRSSTVGASGRFVLKRYNFRRMSRLVKDLFRPSPAFASFRKAYHLELLNIATARPVAAADRRLFRFLRQSYFLMEEIPDAISLEACLRNGRQPERQLAESLGELLGRLHREGLSHRDLKCSNLVLDGEGRPHLIDLDGLSFLGEVPETRARDDLARFARSVAELGAMDQPPRLWFLRAYLTERRRPD